MENIKGLTIMFCKRIYIMPEKTTQEITQETTQEKGRRKVIEGEN